MQCSRESRKHHVGWLCFFAYPMTRNDQKGTHSRNTQWEAAKQNIMGIIAIGNRQTAYKSQVAELDNTIVTICFFLVFLSFCKEIKGIMDLSRTDRIIASSTVGMGLWCRIAEPNSERDWEESSRLFVLNLQLKSVQFNQEVLSGSDADRSSWMIHLSPSKRTCEHSISTSTHISIERSRTYSAV